MKAKAGKAKSLLPSLNTAQVQAFDPLRSPYSFMYVSESMTAVLPGSQNWNPTPYSRTYSMDAWVSPAVAMP